MKRMQLARLVSSRRVSTWSDVKLAPPDKILGLNDAFKADTFAQKMNLGVGAYRSDSGSPVVLPSVRIAEQRIFEKKMDKEYAPIAGVGSFINLGLEFAYGADCVPLKEKRIAAVQAISGTGACRLAGEFISKFLGRSRAVHIPNPTWGNHVAIFENCGLKPVYYPYYNREGNCVDFKNYLDYVNKLEKEVFLLHACAHNPTGADPSKEQWQELSHLFKKKQHVAIFDSAYQGFASGNPENDAFALREFVRDGHQILLCQSFSKNFGLYGERAGLLSVVTESVEEAERVNSQLKVIIRPMYSNPPVHGARIVAEVLGDPVLKQQWLGECKGMADRILKMRVLFKETLETLSPGRSWKHITDQIGMFCYTGLTKEEVMRLRSEFHVYCTDDGRFSVAGITPANVDYLAAAVASVTAHRG